MKKQYFIYALLLAYGCSALAVKPMPQGKEQVHQNVQVTESSVTDTDNENKDGAEQAPKKPTILESWRKVFSLNLRSLNRDDAWNFGKTVTFAGVGYFLYSYLPKGLNGPNGGFNNPNNPGGPNGPNRPRVIGEDDDFDIDGFDLEQRRQQEEAFARYEREKENRRIAQEQAERNRRALEQAEQLNRQVQEVARRDRERVERERELQRQEEARRQQETFERAERNRVAQVEQAERDRRMQREREAQELQQREAQQERERQAAEYEQGIRWAREERARLLEEQRQQRQAEHERLAQRERERQAVDQERYQQHSADVAQRIERGLPIRLYAEWLAGQQSQEVRERQAQEDREYERRIRERREAQQERERQAQVERERREAERVEQLRQLQEQAERMRLAREEAQRQEERTRLAQEEQTRRQEETRRMREAFQRRMEEQAERERQLQQQEADELAEAIRQSQLMEDERIRNASVATNDPVEEAQAPQVIVEQAQQRECDLCAEERNVNEYTEMPCCQYNSLCTTCLGDHLAARLEYNSLAEVTCPNRDCRNEHGDAKKIEHHVMRALTVNNRALFDRYLNIEMNEGLREIPGVRQCRTPNCNFMYFPYDENRPGSIVCGRCNERYCSHCGFNHAENMTCAQAERERDPDLAEQANQEWIRENTKPCPNCNDPIEKNGGCNHMTCQKCRHEFCWTCLATYRTTRCNSAECETYGIQTGLNF